VSSIAIYLEGGGNTAHTKAALRLGMTEFLSPLKEAVRAKAWRWKLVPCGGRNSTFEHFKNAVENGDDTIVALLVDAEGPVKNSIRAHLRARDNWDLSFASDDVVHLMAQTMESWIVADPEALSAYYGRNFQIDALPKTVDLETVAKGDIGKALDGAIRLTQKKKYHKINHASEILTLIDREKVRKRCHHCARLLDTLLKMIQGG
jgi:hypothetical protein